LDYKERTGRKVKKKGNRVRGLAAILRGGIQLRDPEKAYAQACYMIERDLHQTITPDYPVAKFLAQVELLNEDYKMREREMKKIKRFRR